MRRLRFTPRGFAPRPPELLTEGAPPVAILLGRRQFLRALAFVLGALAAPWTGARRVWARAHGRYFTADERATLEALVDRIIPPDDPPDSEPGAKALGAARYIEQLLTAFDHRPPRIFAGGPFSGRAPFADDRTGEPTHRRPRDAFRRFIPLSRLEELRWRAEIFGSARVRELPAALVAQRSGPLVGLRDLYRQGLAKVNEVARAAAGAIFVELGTDVQDTVFKMLDAGVFPADPARGGMTFIDILIQHTLEGCFCPPEYGGNRGGGGWRILGIEGDDQPLGFSQFSRDAGTYKELPAHPVSGPEPDDVGPDGSLQPRPLGPDAQAIVNRIINLTDAIGPQCLE